jgi:hypothetical protein
LILAARLFVRLAKTPSGRPFNFPHFLSQKYCPLRFDTRLMVVLSVL